MTIDLLKHTITSHNATAIITPAFNCAFPLRDGGGRESSIKRGLFYLYAQPGIKVKQRVFFFSSGDFLFLLFFLATSFFCSVFLEGVKF